MGGRFLKKDYEADIWIEVSDVVAREKVCQVSLCRALLAVSPSIIKYLTLMHTFTFLCHKVLRTFVSAIKDSDSLESDRSSSSSSEGIKSEEEEDGSGADEMCYIRGGGEGEEDQSGLLPRVKDEADGYFNSDDAMATDDVPKKYFKTSSAALPIVSGRFESARDNFGVGANHTFASASHSSDFDLFEGELLRSFACDEIFVASSPKDPV